MKNKISEHTTRKEWECRCGCGTCEPSKKIITAIEVGRTCANVYYWGRKGILIPNTKLYDKLPLPVKVHLTSGSRCQPHNDRSPKVKNSRGVYGAGGSKNSQHITISGKVYRMLESPLSSIKPSEAADGWFYYGRNIKSHRVDCSGVLIQMYKDGWIRGLILYNKYRFHIDCRTGKKYFSDRRAA